MEFDVILSVPTVCRLLKGARISYKKNQSVVGQRNKELIIVWSFKQRQWDVRQLIFIDESASNKCIGDRRYR
jgi:transposase